MNPNLSNYPLGCENIDDIYDTDSEPEYVHEPQDRSDDIGVEIKESND